MSIFFIRHAQATGQEADAPLSETGQRQANDLIDVLANLKIDAVFASPFSRAIHTIRPYADHMDLEVEIIETLKERTLAGAPRADWQTHIERSFTDRNHQLKGGESMNQTCVRALQAVRQIRAGKAGRSGAVSHGNLIASLLSHIDPNFGFEDWRRMKNPDIFELAFDGDKIAGYHRHPV